MRNYYYNDYKSIAQLYGLWLSCCLFIAYSVDVDARFNNYNYYSFDDTAIRNLFVAYLLSSVECEFHKYTNRRFGR